MTIVTTGYSSVNPAEQGLISLNGRDAVLSLWYHDSTLDNFSLSKGNKERKKILISSGKIKNEKHRNEKENSNYVLLVSINFNLTYGLKPQVSGIKIVTVYRRSTFQVERLTATFI